MHDLEKAQAFDLKMSKRAVRSAKYVSLTVLSSNIDSCHRIPKTLGLAILDEHDGELVASLRWEDTPNGAGRWADIDRSSSII